MSLRKLKAAKIFDGRTLLENKVLVIGKNGVVEGVFEDNGSDQDIEMYDGILSPGFVNCHCHLELSHLKNQIEEHTGLIDFVSKVMCLRSFEKEAILQAIQAADQQMYDNGIVAVGDICNTTDTVAQKRNSRILYRNFVETMGFVPQMASARFEASLKNVYEPLFAENSATSVVPHAPYSVSGDLFGLINRHSKGKIVTIHNQETTDENQLFENGQSGFRDFYQRIKTDIGFFEPTGKSSLQTYLPMLDLAERILLVHNTQTSEQDILFAEMLAKENHQELYWILCPNANLYIENKLPHVDVLRKHHCKIALGTDSLSSNHQLNMISEIQSIQQYFAAIPLEELLQWATLSGARALGFGDMLGSFEKGKKPGVLLLGDDLVKVTRIA